MKNHYIAKRTVHQYRVKWEIDIDADTPEEAAKEAYRIMERARENAPCLDLKDETGKRFKLPVE